MDQDALIPLPPQDLGDLRDQPELQALLANPALMNHPQIAQLYAQFQQDQANLMNLPPLPPLPPVPPLPPLQQQQDVPMNQDPMLPLQPPVVPAAAQAPPPAAAAQHPLAPQFHLHMQGFMDGFAAIPVLGFAPLGPGQFPPPLRRRVAVARRLPPPPPPPPAAVPPQPQNAAGIVAGILQVAVDRAEAPAQVEGVQIHAIPVYRGGLLHPPMVFGGALAALRNVPADAPPDAGNAAEDDNAVHRGDFRLDDPMDIAAGMGLFDEDWLGPLRGDFGDDEPVERRRPATANDGAGERTPPRDVPARLEEPCEQEIHASCPICILPFKNDTEGSRTARVLSCGHLICSGCVKQFLRNLKENRTMSYHHSYDKAPCVVCQRTVHWRGIPECKTVGYLYEQLELTNDERSTVDEAAIAKIRTDARKRTHRLLDNISSSCHEMATKIRKLVRKADRVYDDSLERASHATGRETWRRIESEAHADAVVKVVQDEADRLSYLEILFNEQYVQLNKLLEEITSSPLNIPKEHPAKLLTSDAVLTLCLFTAVALSYRDLGAPGWSCDEDLMKRSKKVPENVHSLRPADIDIIAAIGDSLTAGNGAGAEGEDVLAIAIQFRGLNWAAGGDNSLDEHITITNILKKFNPNLFGYSIRTGSANVWETAHLNAGVPGAHSADVYEQANDLMRRMKDHPDIDFMNQWKLVHIFIGANDICSWCHRGDSMNADAYREHLRKGIQYMKENMPKTIVVLTGMIDINLLRRIDNAHLVCKEIHTFECKCEGNATVTDADLSGICHGYMTTMQELQDSGEFDTTDDFTLIIEPYLELTTDIGRNPDGTPNMDFFAPDCFHFAAYGHAIVAKNLWNNMLQPVGGKTAANLTDNGEPLICPDKDCPFIRTTKNSDNCASYMN
ncbi:hypothetical protein PRIPAC_89339 [Pristionchus pacificus]|uniref:Phospholipase B1, membrane-associated n=1 Tax=Pristionchus pacificus TaxID=54126 RepID=A0A2A6CTE1_PRIPA|nr:hypothetical protein PRIPAC_89339 [Pristionchus pacificus]|eukprot:PDM81455.1 lipase [Pristionchus pacificus]